MGSLAWNDHHVLVSAGIPPRMNTNLPEQGPFVAGGSRQLLSWIDTVKASQFMGMQGADAPVGSQRSILQALTEAQDRVVSWNLTLPCGETD
jgi:hypothetical protein